MRNELIQKIMMAMAVRGIDAQSFQEELVIILNDYEVTERETALAVLQEDRNEFLIRKFLIAKTVAGRTERTISFYRDILYKAISEIGKTIDEITADDIRLYLALRAKRDKVSKTTQGNELRTFSSFFSYLLAEELITKNPVARIESIKQKKTKKKAFTDMEVEQMRNACETTRQKAVVEVLLSTGCRVTELVNIKIADIHDGKLIVHGKGEKDRTVYLNAKAQIAIDNYLKDRKDNNPYLFCSGIFGKPKKGVKSKEWYKYPDLVKADERTDVSNIESMIRKLKVKAGVQSAYPHKFRRTCATMALRRGMSVEQVSKMLGHESIATTQIYLDLSEEDLEQAHRKYVI